jgi:DNA-binding transcriptional ArsR family regulator
MPSAKVELILHPQRLRILQTLAAACLTTQEIADRLPGLPKSSIYRHLKVLLDAGLITVAATRPVKGVEEKVYRLEQLPTLGPDDLAGLTPDEHLRYFTSFVASLLHGFAAYLDHIPHPDLYADIVGYRESIFYATDEEFVHILTTMNQALAPLISATSPGPGRKRRKLATVTHPIPEPGRET